MFWRASWQFPAMWFDYTQQELKLIQMLQTENKLGNSINLENIFNVGESQPT